MFAATDLTAHQSGRLQHPMWRDTPAKVIGSGAAKSVMRASAVPQGLKQAAASRIGQCAVGAIQHLIFNHLVDDSGQGVLCWNPDIQLFLFN